MSSETGIYSMLLPDRPVAFNRDFVRLGIGITGALFLSQAIYWAKRTKGDGWFYKTAEDWELETGMTRREQETARKKLKALGILLEKKKGVPCKLHYKIKADHVISLLISSMAESDKLDSTKPPSSMAESAELDCTDAPSSDGGIRQTITENTQRLPQRETISAPAPQPTQDFSPQPEPPSAPPPRSANLETQPMTPDWEPKVSTLVPALARSAIPIPVAEALAQDPELVNAFRNHQLANPGREYSPTGWTTRLATWLQRDWQRLGRPLTITDYQTSRGFNHAAGSRTSNRDEVHAAVGNWQDTSWADGLY